MDKLRLGTRVVAGATVEPVELRNQECVIVANRDEEYLLIPDAKLSRIFYHLLPADFAVLAAPRQRRPGPTSRPGGERPSELDF